MAQQLSLFDVSVSPPTPPGRVLVARGALAAEAILLERVGALAEEARREPRLLGLPVRIVVPSRSLRTHLGAAIVRSRGRSVAGVMIQTLHGLAREILERAGEVPLAGEPLFGVVAQRRAREEAILRQGLAGLVDGFGAVVGTVRDLVDAGFEPEHAEAAGEALATDGPGLASRAEVERARALVRVAAGTGEILRDLGLGDRAALLRRAVEILEADPVRALPARSILIHGFSDAIGMATDLLAVLLRKRSAWLVLDHPPEPLGDGVEKAFTGRFAGRLVLAVGTLEPAAPRQVPSPPVVTSYEAVGAEAEAREAARRVRELLDGGARPEGIGLVARDLGPYRLPLRRHLRRLGVPFSGVGERGALEPAGRRIGAFLELLRRGEDVPVDRWLDAVASFSSGGKGRILAGGLLVDLRLAFASLGAARLRDVAALPVDTVLPGDSYPLPIRQGLKTAGAARDEEDPGGEGEGSGEAHTYANRRRVPSVQIRNAVEAAGRLCRRLSSWPGEAPADVFLHKTVRLLVGSLGWKREDGSAKPVFAALEELGREVPPDFPLTRDELRLLLERLLEGAGASALGGEGGGVQVLSVIEARSRTFEHLFVLGLNRDVFPRGIREDPLLRDDLRLVLQRVLPDVPVKRSGFDEERYLFAQLLSASPFVTLSWQAADDDGRPLPASPLVERLRERIEPAKAPPLYALPAAGPLPGPRPADEHAILAGLHAPRRWFGRVLPFALEEVRAGLGGFSLDPAALAASRLAVLDEMDPDLRTPEGRAVRARLGPYFGFIGHQRTEGGDPRLRPLYVTNLENLAACPWQLFLGRLLRIEPTPDPLAALPGIDLLLLGNVVHAVLDRIARPSSPPPEPEDWDRIEPVPVPWPSEEDLNGLVLEEAGRLLAEEGVFLPGLARALADRARPFLDEARDLDWAAGGVPVLATEREGEVMVRGGGHGSLRPLRFKADRMDAAGPLLVWTDYKTGRPISDKKTPEVRRRHFLARVREGKNLQAVAYLLGSRGKALGRYLFLRPDVGGEAREFTVSIADRDFFEAFASTTAALLDAWDQGAFFPRVVDTAGREEPPRCKFCNLTEACLRGDSGARLRLLEWTGPARQAESWDQDAPRPAEKALLEVWDLAKPQTQPRPSGEEERIV